MSMNAMSFALWVVLLGLVFTFGSCLYRVFVYADMSWMPGCVFAPIAIVMVAGGLRFYELEVRDDA